MDVPKGIENGMAVSIFFIPCSNSREISFGGTNPARMAPGVFAPRSMTLRASSNGTIDNPHPWKVSLSVPLCLNNVVKLAVV